MKPGLLKSSSKEVLIEEAISKAINHQGVKVDREEFLSQVFSSRVADIQQVLDFGPVEAGIPREELADIAHKLIIDRTGSSSVAPIKSAIPGQHGAESVRLNDREVFFATALRIAQELSYIYGAKDMWVDGQFDNERVKNRLMIYCGVMFGVSGAASALRIITSKIANTAMKASPLRIIKGLFKKSFFRKALSSGIVKSAIPVVSGAVSGGINYAAMLPMAKNLLSALDEAAFDYTEDEFATDVAVLESLSDVDGQLPPEEIKAPEKKRFLPAVIKKTSSPEDKTKKGKKKKAGEEDSFEQMIKYKDLLDRGIISEEEFEHKKKELLNL